MAYNGEMIKCPHCECKVRLSDVENEDGFCPECGQVVLNSGLADELEGDEYQEDEQFNDDDGGYDDDDDDTEHDVLDELNYDSICFSGDDDEPGKRRRGRPGSGRRK